MIFKRWFKPKWQHQDAAVRMAAIATLDDNTPAQKQILHELAFNDGTEAVRKAALQRLNEFSLWWQASKHDNAERLRQFAEQQLVEMLLQNQVDAQLKRQFIDECQRSSILEKLAQTEQDVALRLKLLKRLAKPELYAQALTDERLPLAEREPLLALIDDDKTLERLQRQASDELATLLQQTLSARQQAKEKPLRVRKQLTLLLARLNAVREKTDLAMAESEWAVLTQQWQQLAAELGCLTPEEQQQAAQKYQRICDLTEAAFAPKRAQWRAEQQAIALAAERAQRFAQYNTTLTQLSAQADTLIATGALTGADDLQAQTVTLSLQISQADLAAGQQKQLLAAAQALEQRLARLPLLAEAMAQASRLLAEYSALPLPAEADVGDAWQKFLRWQAQWRQVSTDLPADFSRCYQQLVQQWQQHCKPLLDRQQKNQRQLKGKLAEIKRLHQQGRYNTIFGLWRSVCQSIEAEPALASAVGKELEQCRQLVDSLTELQAFVATPRKQAVLTELQALIADTELPPHERAQTVKRLRQTWSSLGRAEAGLDEQLNQQFNQLIEEAFLPCREFYAQQDAQRLAAATRREQLISRLDALLAEPVAAAALDKALQQIQQQWRQAGPVEKSRHQQLTQAYQTRLTTLKLQQQQLFQQAAAAKEQLIAEAELLLNQEDGPQLVALVKQLQQRWKQTGFAGVHADQALWLKFRAACDAVFARRDEQRQQASAAQQQWRQSLAAQLSLLAADNLASLGQQQLTERLSQLRGLDTGKDAELRAQKNALQQATEQQLQQLASSEQRGEYQQLFAALQHPEVSHEQLPAVYRLVFNQQQEPLSRLELTLALEWAAGVASPEAEQPQRQQVQMQLLSDKLNQGEDVSMPQLLGRWLRHGPLQSDEQALLQRVSALFLREN